MVTVRTVMEVTFSAGEDEKIKLFREKCNHDGYWVEKSSEHEVVFTKTDRKVFDK